MSMSPTGDSPVSPESPAAPKKLDEQVELPPLAGESLFALDDSTHARSLLTRVGMQFLFKYFRGIGRTTAAEYWVYMGFLAVLITAALLIDRRNQNLLVFTIVAAATAFPTMGFTVRRLHDVERNGWWMWFPIIPTVFTVKTISAAVPGYLTAYFGWSDNAAALHQHLQGKYLAWLMTAVFVGLSTVIAFLMVGIPLLLPGSPEANKYGERDY